MSPDRSYFSSKLLTYSMLAALLITSICQIYSFLKFKSNYQLKSENIARAGKRLSIRFKAANESFVRYANDYTHLNRLITVKDSKVLSEAFNAFNQWGDVHLQLADERANLEHQLYANRQNALSLKKNFDQ